MGKSTGCKPLLMRIGTLHRERARMFWSTSDWRLLRLNLRVLGEAVHFRMVPANRAWWTVVDVVPTLLMMLTALVAGQSTIAKERRTGHPLALGGTRAGRGLPALSY